jgi:hypothetical protein
MVAIRNVMLNDIANSREALDSWVYENDSAYFFKGSNLLQLCVFLYSVVISTWSTSHKNVTVEIVNSRKCTSHVLLTHFFAYK